ncbi:MAG: AAA family ATPase [Ferroplasma sp.]
MIIITGMPGSGKDEFVRVAVAMGFRDAHMGNTVKKYAIKDGVSMTDNAIGAYATEARKTYGMDIWARRTAADIKFPGCTIVDGLRNEEELNYFKKTFKCIIVIAVFANETDRLDRIIKRDREDDANNYDDIQRRDNRELSWGIGRVISLADYMIVNDSSLDVYRKNAKLLLEDILKKHPEINLDSCQ